jgi:uncharacterized membrane protein
MDFVLKNLLIDGFLIDCQLATIIRLLIIYPSRSYVCKILSPTSALQRLVKRVWRFNKRCFGRFFVWNSSSLHNGSLVYWFSRSTFRADLYFNYYSGERELSAASKSSKEKPVQQKRKTPTKTMWKHTLADLSATLIGAVFIAFAIAPTDEVPMLAAAASPFWILAIMATSLLVSYTIVFAAGFTNQKKRHQQQGFFQRPSGETVFSYLVSLLASVLMLWFFQQLSWEDPWDLWLSYTVILGLPSTIGGAAGRIAV